MESKSLLRKVRTLKGWTQDDLIARLACADLRTRSAVSKIESTGRVKPATGLKLARVFRLPPSVLFPLVFPEVPLPNANGHGRGSSVSRARCNSRRKRRHE